MTFKSFISHITSIFAIALFFVPQLEAHAGGYIFLGSLATASITMILLLSSILLYKLGKKSIKHIPIIVLGVIFSIFIPWKILNSFVFFMLLADFTKIFILIITIPTIQSLIWYSWFKIFKKKLYLPLIITSYIATILSPILFLILILIGTTTGLLR